MNKKNESYQDSYDLTVGGVDKTGERGPQGIQGLTGLKGDKGNPGLNSMNADGSLPIQLSDLAASQIRADETAVAPDGTIVFSGSIVIDKTSYLSIYRMSITNSKTVQLTIVRQQHRSPAISPF